MARFARRLARGLVAAFSLLAAAAHAQTQVGSALTYQGELRASGQPAAGPVDLRFRLYDSLTVGNQVGPAIDRPNIALSQGRFSQSLDFGPAAFGPDARWLEIDVRSPAGSGNYVTLTPRQRINPAPVSQFSLEAASATSAAAATNAAQLSGQSAAFYQNAGNLNNGTLSDSRLSANVGLLSGAQTFAGPKTFSSAPSFIAAGAPFTVSNSTVVTNLNADLLDGFDSTSFLHAVPMPLILNGNTPGYIILGENAGATDGAVGVFGNATGSFGVTYGGWFQSASNLGIGATGWTSSLAGSTSGIYGRADSTAGRGVAGWASAATGITVGVRGESASSTGFGAYGIATSNTGAAYGGRFDSLSTGGIGLMGWASAATGNTRGVWGESASPSGIGVFGRATATTAGQHYGVWGETSSPSGTAVEGYAMGNVGVTTGVRGDSTSSSGRGVYGLASALTGGAAGVRGDTTSTTGRGIQGFASSETGASYGVFGSTASQSANAAGVFGIATATNGFTTAGVWGETVAPSGIGTYGINRAITGIPRGVFGDAPAATGVGTYGIGGGYGVLGATSSGGGWAVYANGNLGASGTKPFRIDHPADPENRYLLHYAAESPDVINFYSGKITLDGAGGATVELPAYFARINKDPRYTLTALGAPMPMLHVAVEVSDADLAAGAAAAPSDPVHICSFRVAGGTPGGRVSWEVKALRNDRWVQQHGAPVETEKPAVEKGTYQHPDLYGRPADLEMYRLRTDPPVLETPVITPLEPIASPSPEARP